MHENCQLRFCVETKLKQKKIKIKAKGKKSENPYLYFSLEILYRVLKVVFSFHVEYLGISWRVITIITVAPTAIAHHYIAKCIFTINRYCIVLHGTVQKVLKSPREFLTICRIPSSTKEFFGPLA